MGGGMVPPCILVGGGMVPPFGDERQAMVPAEGVKGHANRCRHTRPGLAPCKKVFERLWQLLPNRPAMILPRCSMPRSARIRDLKAASCAAW
jgi:hypothetical protein